MTLLQNAVRLSFAVLALGWVVISVSTFAVAQNVPNPRETKVVNGGNGVQIAVQEWGNPDGRPIVFVHALVSSHMGYLPVVAQGPLAETFRLITFDMRGHGNSEKPTDIAAYQDGEQLADDLAAVIELTGGQDPIIVAWSTGGVVLGDYLAKYGDDGIAGAVCLGAGHTLGEAAVPYIGAGFAEFAEGMMSSDLAENVQATIGVTMANTAKPLPPELFTMGVATAMVVPPHARAGLVSRSVNHIEDTLPSVEVPIMFLHGSADQIVSPTSSKNALEAASNGTYVEINGIGHVPTVEAPADVVAAILEVAQVTE